MADWFQPIGINIATLAAVIASQALISGSFTLINEAMRLNFWPKVKIEYPTEVKGQLYIPLSTGYFFGVGIVLHFEESEYGTCLWSSYNLMHDNDHYFT
jgi:KUP system potassium uptake protein